MSKVKERKKKNNILGFLIFLFCFASVFGAGSLYLKVFASINQVIVVESSIQIDGLSGTYYEKIYQEDVTGGTYTLVDTREKEALHNTIVYGNTTPDYGFTFYAEHENTIYSGTVDALGTPLNLSLYFTRNTYTITLNFNDGGVMPNGTISCKYGDTPSSIPAPSYWPEGYDFGGWEFNSESYIPSPVTQDITLTAVWDRFFAITYIYEVTNDVNTTSGFINSYPTRYSRFTPEINFAAGLFRDYYEFVGFFDASYTSGGGARVTSIPAGSTGNKTLYVRFTAFSYTINYANYVPPGSYTNGSMNISFSSAGSTPTSHTIVYNVGGTLKANTFSLSAVNNLGTYNNGSTVPTFLGWNISGGNIACSVNGGATGAIPVNGYNSGWYLSGTQGANSTIEYLINNLGIANGASITLGPVWDLSTMTMSLMGACLAEGTNIGTGLTESKLIEELVVGEYILVWNHSTGSYDYAPVILIQKTEMNLPVGTLNFDDGTRVDIIYGHSFFSMEQNRYVEIYLETIEDHLGEHFYKVNSDGTLSIRRLVDYEIVVKETVAYGLVTGGHYNHIAEGFISAVTYTPLFNMFDFAGENLQIDEVQKQIDIDFYGLYEYDVWEPYLTYDEYIMFNAAYMKVAVGKGLITFEEIVKIILSDFPRSEIV